MHCLSLILHFDCFVRAGNFLGQMNAYKAFTYTTALGEQAMSCSWEASYGSTPWGDYAPLKGLPMITTNDDTTTTTPVVYTPSLQDTYEMLLQAQGTAGDWASRLLAVNGYALRSVPDKTSFADPIPSTGAVHNSDKEGMKFTKVGPGLDRTPHPLVDTYCLYGTNLSTSYGFVFPQGILDSAATETLYMEGDGNQDIIDNRFCNVWAQDATAQKLGYVFEATEFPNVSHMEMYSDENVMLKVRQILDKYNN